MELPLVITKVGMFANEEGDRAYAKFVDAGESNALAEAMGEVLTDLKKRDEMITAGYEAVQKYNWATIANIANDLYIEARSTAALPLGNLRNRKVLGLLHARPTSSTRSAHAAVARTRGVVRL